MRVTGGWADAIRSAVARSLDQLRIKQRPLRASVAAARNGVFLPRPARSIDDGYGLRSGRGCLHGLDGCGVAGGELARPSWRACCLPSASPSRAVWVLGGALVATMAVGSPPSGSLTKAAHATTTKPETPRMPATN